jgi:hypothetical protein
MARETMETDRAVAEAADRLVVEVEAYWGDDERILRFLNRKGELSDVYGKDTPMAGAWQALARAVFDRRKAAIRAKARVGVGVGAMTD